jgi:hypothetical protein
LLDHGKLDIGGVGAAAASWHPKDGCLNGCLPSPHWGKDSVGIRHPKSGCLERMRHPKEGCLLDHGKLDIGGVGAAAAGWHLKNRCLNGWHPASEERMLRTNAASEGRKLARSREA